FPYTTLFRSPGLSAVPAGRGETALETGDAGAGHRQPPDPDAAQLQRRAERCVRRSEGSARKDPRAESESESAALEAKNRVGAEGRIRPFLCRLEGGLQRPHDLSGHVGDRWSLQCGQMEQQEI